MMNLKDWREGQGLTQTEVSATLGISPGQWCRYEKNNLIPIRQWKQRNDFLLLYQSTGIGILDVWPEIEDIL